ncbi:unnamed protein product [marine sediment metagenome]|uniref:Uncharacterized protein n=1 Tax=marine sediment metagenome TaxID=412755 RepID=X1R0F8_9ZZZZ
MRRTEPPGQNGYSPKEDLSSLVPSARLKELGLYQDVLIDDIHLSGEKIQYNSQIDKSHENPDVGDISYPDLVYRVDRRVFNEIRKYRLRMFAIGSPDFSLSYST